MRWLACACLCVSVSGFRTLLFHTTVKNNPDAVYNVLQPSKTCGLSSYLGQLEKRQEEIDTWAPGCPDLEVTYVKLHFGYMGQTITAKLV